MGTIGVCMDFEISSGRSYLDHDSKKEKLGGSWWCKELLFFYLRYDNHFIVMILKSYYLLEKHATIFMNERSSVIMSVDRVGGVTFNNWHAEQYIWSWLTVTWVHFCFLSPFFVSLKFSIIKNQKEKKQWGFSKLLMTAWLNDGCTMGKEVSYDWQSQPGGLRSILH